jgi:hypothetical protein
MLIDLNPDTAAKTRAYPDEFDCPESDYLIEPPNLTANS